MEEITLNDLKTILSQSVDISTHDTIDTDLKTNIINQDLFNNNLVPSVQNAILLKNKYEVLKVDKNFNGTLEDLIKQQGKRIPSELPFINILLVGAGSSGGWKKPQPHKSWYISAGIGGELITKKINNISLNSTVEITIGKGGIGKDSQLQIYSGPSKDSPEDTIDTSIVLGNNTIFNINEEEYIAYGGGQEYNEKGFRSNPSLKSEYQIFCDNDSFVDIKESTFKNLIFNIENNYYTLHSYQRVGGLEIDIIAEESSSSNRLTQYTDYSIYLNAINKNNYNNIQKFLSTIKNNLKNKPNSLLDDDSINPWYTYNEYGCYIKAGRYAKGKCVFFDGLDGSDFGSPGSPGDYTYIYYHDDTGDEDVFKHCGKMGTGADGVCYIYYPKEV